MASKEKGEAQVVPASRQSTETPTISQEDRKLIRSRSAAARERARVREEMNNIIAKKFRPWMKQYAAWLAAQPKLPDIRTRLVMARRLVRGKISKNQLRAVEVNEQFQEFYKSIDEDAIKRARAEIEGTFSEYVQAHKDGLDMALGAKDYKEIPKYTVPMLDRIYPKRGDEAPPPSTIVLNIGMGPQMQLVRAVLDEVEESPADVEIVEE